MALRKIRLQGDEVLAKVSRPVEKMTPRIHDLIGDMLETMYDAMGVGLAAPQVGMLKRIVVIDIGEGPIVLINPEILETSGEQTGDEGCLSVPGMAGQVTRPNYVKVKAMDEDSDDEMTAMDEEEMEQAQDSSEKDSTESTDHAAENKMDEKGTYTDKNDVAQYIYEYGHAPSNLTPENYENADSMLPVEEGVTYQQCSLDPEGKQKLIYTQDGKRVYYTEDDGKSFEEIY